MRIACLIGTPPKKLGSLEDWMLGLAEEARRRGHAFDLYTLLPRHPVFEAELVRKGAGFGSIEALVSSPVDAVRRLSEYDVLHVNMLAPRSQAALICYAAWPARIVLVDHLSLPKLPNVLRIRRELSRALDQFTYARVDELVGVSNYVRARDVTRFGLDPAHTRVIYNGVDPRRFTTEKTKDPSGRLRLIAVSQLIPEKGLDILIRAMREVRTPSWHLNIVGYGRMEAEYRRLVEELGLSGKVELLGMRDDVPELFKRSDVYVHPAVWEEAGSLAILEGMASGSALVATHVGGTPEMVRDGTDGILVPRGDVGALARAIDRLAEDPGLRERFAQNGRRSVEERFHMDRWVKDHLDCIEEVGRRRRRRRGTSPSTGGGTRNETEAPTARA